jgi:hypothetical protein
VVISFILIKNLLKDKITAIKKSDKNSLNDSAIESRNKSRDSTKKIQIPKKSLTKINKSTPIINKNPIKKSGKKLIKQNLIIIKNAVDADESGLSSDDEI